MSVTGGQYVVAKPIQDLIEKHIYDGVGNAMQIWRQMQKEQPPPVQVPNWPPSITQVKKVWQAQQIQQTLDTGPRAPARKRTDYDKTVSKCVGCSVQGDLAQMTKIELFNKLKTEGGVGQWDVVEKWPASWSPDAAGYTVPPNATSNIVKNLGRYVLTFIDIRSRYVHAIILRSKDENEVLRGIKALVERMKAQGNPIKNLNFDEERAVNSNVLHNYLHGEDITLWLSGPRRGKPTQFVVERFIRTFRTRLRLYLRTRQTKRWVDIFPKVIESYNNAHHSSLGGPPAEFYESNDIPEYMEFNAWQSPLTKFKPGDIVRVRKPPDIFDKRSDVKYWTKNLYRVVGLAPYDREVDKFPAEAPDKQVPPGVSRRFKLVKDPNPKGDPPIERRWYDMVLVDKKNVRVYEPKQPGTKALGQAVKTMAAQRRQPQSAVSQPETILNTRTRQNRTINPRVAAALGKNKKLLVQGGKGMSCPKGKAKCDCDLPVVDLNPQRGRGRPKGKGNRHFGAYDAYEEHGEKGGAILERLSRGAQGKSLAALRQRWKDMPEAHKNTLRTSSPTPIKSAVKLAEALAAMRHAPQRGGGVEAVGQKKNVTIVDAPGTKRFSVPKTTRSSDEQAQEMTHKQLAATAKVVRIVKEYTVPIERKLREALLPHVKDEKLLMQMNLQQLIALMSVLNMLKPGTYSVGKKKASPEPSSKPRPNTQPNSESEPSQERRQGSNPWADRQQSRQQSRNSSWRQAQGADTGQSQINIPSSDLINAPEAVDPTSPTYHWSGYNFIGPGSDINSGRLPVNEFDRVGYEHDHAYQACTAGDSSCIAQADQRFVDRLSDAPYFSIENLGRMVIQAKMVVDDRLGHTVYPDTNILAAEVLAKAIEASIHTLELTGNVIVIGSATTGGAVFGTAAAVAVTINPLAIGVGTVLGGTSALALAKALVKKLPAIVRDKVGPAFDLVGGQLGSWVLSAMHSIMDLKKQYPQLESEDQTPQLESDGFTSEEHVRHAGRMAMAHCDAGKKGVAKAKREITKLTKLLAKAKQYIDSH